MIILKSIYTIHSDYSQESLSQERVCDYSHYFKIPSCQAFFFFFSAHSFFFFFNHFHQSFQCNLCQYQTQRLFLATRDLQPRYSSSYSCFLTDNTTAFCCWTALFLEGAQGRPCGSLQLPKRRL